METKNISLLQLENNTGQIPGVNENPRDLTGESFQKAVKSIREFPEMMEARELVVVRHANKYVVIGGNQRLRALSELGYTEAPCKVVNWSVEQINEFIIKDNVSYGDWNWDLISNEWDVDLVTQWGLDLPVDFSPYEEEPPKFIEPKPTKYVITIETEIKSNYEMIKAELDRLNIGYVDCEK